MDDKKFSLYAIRGLTVRLVVTLFLCHLFFYFLLFPKLSLRTVQLCNEERFQLATVQLNDHIVIYGQSLLHYPPLCYIYSTEGVCNSGVVLSRVSPFSPPS